MFCFTSLFFTSRIRGRGGAEVVTASILDSGPSTGFSELLPRVQRHCLTFASELASHPDLPNLSPGQSSSAVSQLISRQWGRAAVRGGNEGAGWK